jgi:ribosomal protein S18 acetylase RimI-like enzyme
MIAASTQGKRAQGIRRVNLSQDLGKITDLIEVCFSPRMDAGARATIREMRALSRMGPLLGLLALGDDMLRGIGAGFVWEEDGRIIGNVTLFPARVPRDVERTIVVANVAVDPAYRRRGIARQLMDASLEALHSSGAGAAILQVETDNAGARQLYLDLGFRTERTWHEWRRAREMPPPRQLMNSPRISLRPGTMWRTEYELARRIFPAERGGLGWQRPLHVREFRRTPLEHLTGFLSGTTVERWIVREGRQIAGALWARTQFGSGLARLTLLVPPEEQERLVDPLLNYGLRRLSLGTHSLYCEHPADDVYTTAALEGCQFRRRRTLDHMRLDL